MEERARRLGGDLRIESEPGEGTRIELRFSVESEEQTGEARASAR
jgi:two-component system nitrate/nitrite sensor histidine kinase NarX